MFGEAGAGNNISLIVSQSAATPVRGKFYGAAAACGKVGGFIGTHSFIHLMEAFGGEGSKLGIRPILCLRWDHIAEQLRELVWIEEY